MQRRFESGIGLVELMIGLVISLLAVLVIFETFQAFEGQKRTTTSAVAAQEAGLLALTAIERDARVAGYGLVANGALACTTMTLYANGAVQTVPALPIAITDGGANDSDSITVTYSTASTAATPSTLSVDAPTSGPAIAVANTANNATFQVGDFFLVAQPSYGKPCSRLRVTGTVTSGSDVQLMHSSSDAVNPPSAMNMFPITPTAGYSASQSDPSLVINMGRMIRSTYSVNNNSLAYTDTTSNAAPITLSTGIVAMQAQYGVADVGAQNVSQWVDAKGAWLAPTIGDIARIKAVRIAVVARSELLEKLEVTKPCKSAAGVNNGPCAWPDETGSPAPLINLSADADWKRYRYRVFETIVPMRNVVWGNL